jgi:hypothetical protein
MRGYDVTHQDVVLRIGMSASSQSAGTYTPTTTSTAASSSVLSSSSSSSCLTQSAVSIPLAAGFSELHLRVSQLTSEHLYHHVQLHCRGQLHVSAVTVSTLSPSDASEVSSSSSAAAASAASDANSPQGSCLLHFFCGDGGWGG